MDKPGDALTVEDLPLLNVVFSMHPDLEFLLLAGKHARRSNLEYPLNGPSDLKKLFLNGGSLVLNGHAVTYRHVLEFFPEEFFPIEDEETFLRRAIIVLQREALFGKRELPKMQHDTTFFDPAFNTGIPGARIIHEENRH